MIRSEVIWFGSADFEVCRTRLDELGNFSLTSVNSESELISKATVARAAIFEFDGDVPMFVARVRRTRSELVRNGVLIVLVNGAKADTPTFEVAAAKIILDAGRDAAVYGPGSRLCKPIRDFQRDFCRVAHEVVIWNPGPAYSASLKISGKFQAKDEHLLRRSFADFAAIDVNIRSGGLSGSVVYSVVPFDQPRARMLAKIDETSRIAAEVDRFMEFVENSIGYNSYPKIDFQRTIYTPVNSILVESFLEKASPFHQALVNSNPAVVVTSLFEGALRNWRRKSEIRTVKLGSSDVLHFWKILNAKSAAFLEAAAFAKEKLRSPFNGEELVGACVSIPSVTCSFSRVHGDLHCDNVFINAGSSDAVIIDFYKTHFGPTVLDPARLEVDMVFKRCKPIRASTAKQLYRAPLELPSISLEVRSTEIWLVDAVRTTRMLGLAEDRKAYAFAVSCYLIQYASFEENGTLKTRALACSLASSLVNSLLKEKSS